jgi:hypothetical protein
MTLFDMLMYPPSWPRLSVLSIPNTRWISMRGRIQINLNNTVWIIGVITLGGRSRKIGRTPWKGVK